MTLDQEAAADSPSQHLGTPTAQPLQITEHLRDKQAASVEGRNGTVQARSRNQDELRKIEPAAAGTGTASIALNRGPPDEAENGTRLDTATSAALAGASPVGRRPDEQTLGGEGAEHRGHQ